MTVAMRQLLLLTTNKVMKTVLITGASRGIGRACAKLFAENGYNVAVNYFSSEQKARELEKYENVKAFYADVSVKSDVDAMVADIKKSFGPIDILINNAGIAQSKLFTDITESEFDRMIAVHLKGSFNCTQAVLDDMIDKKQGRIINISSIWGITGASCEVHYSMAKAGIIGFTKALAKEVAPSGITVNAIAPGVIDTDMISCFKDDELNEITNEIPLGRIGTPEDVAQSAFFLASENANYITGQVLSINGGIVI